MVTTVRYLNMSGVLPGLCVAPSWNADSEFHLGSDTEGI
jgi:hypothetical protein